MTPSHRIARIRIELDDTDPMVWRRVEVPNRMPVLLSGEAAFETWIEGTPDEAFALAEFYSAEAMYIVRKGEKKDAA